VPKYKYLPNKPVVRTALQLFTSLLVRRTVTNAFVYTLKFTAFKI